MKCGFLALFAVGFASVQAQAAVNAFLRSDPIAFVIQGQDDDASILFGSLAIEAAENEQGTLLEKTLVAPSGRIKIACRQSIMSNQTSCTITIARSAALTVADAEKYARLNSVRTTDAEYIYNHLVKGTSGGFPMYVSVRQDLAFTSTAEDFTLIYRAVSN